ncbi:hypothetical protein HDU99_003773 [Rhizoclosmatium hyalinum]|nr:hypothetical protein HDU99_003773 [Rhizoclosmatium hyalinum]
MPLSPACSYALTALAQEEAAATMAPPGDIRLNAYCTSLGLYLKCITNTIHLPLDPDSVFQYCQFPENDRSLWTVDYTSAVATRSDACGQLNKQVTPRTNILPLPPGMPNPFMITGTKGVSAGILASPSTTIQTTQTTTAVSTVVSTTYTSSGVFIALPTTTVAVSTTQELQIQSPNVPAQELPTSREGTRSP